MWSQGFIASVSVLKIAVVVLMLTKSRRKEHVVQVGAVKIFTTLNSCRALVSHKHHNTLRRLEHIT